MRAYVVDDDRSVADLLRRWLEREGLHVECYYGFADARVGLERDPPDLLFADIRLGDYNGLQLVTIARELRPDMQLVVMSAWDDPVLVREAAMLGATYLHKPFQPAALEEILGTALAARRHRLSASEG